MRSFGGRVLFWGGIAAVVLLLLWAVLAPQAVPADLVTIEHGALQVTLDEEGETRVRERYVVSAPVAGQVMRIELEPGDPVRAAESVLATFRPADSSLLDTRSRSEIEASVKAAQAAVGRARTDRERTRAELRFALAELERERRLAEAGIISREALDGAELEAQTWDEAVKGAEFALRSARHELERAQAGLLQPHAAGQDTTSERTIAIRSPIDGVVLRRLLESEVVVPSGEPLIEIADPADLEIVADFLSTEAVKIRRAQRVIVEQWGGDRALSGRVRRVEPSGFTKVSALGVEEQRVNVLIDLEDSHEAWAALGDGFRVEVRVIVWEGEDLLKVPMSSLFRHEGRWAVFVADGDRARLQPTEIGRHNGVEAVVRSGLAAGERVVAHPSDALADGVRLTER